MTDLDAARPAVTKISCTGRRGLNDQYAKWRMLLGKARSIDKVCAKVIDSFVMPEGVRTADEKAWHLDQIAGFKQDSQDERARRQSRGAMAADEPSESAAVGARRARTSAPGDMPPRRKARPAEHGDEGGGGDGQRAAARHAAASKRAARAHQVIHAQKQFRDERHNDKQAHRDVQRSFMMMAGAQAHAWYQLERESKLAEVEKIHELTGEYPPYAADMNKLMQYLDEDRPTYPPLPTLVPAGDDGHRGDSGGDDSDDGADSNGDCAAAGASGPISRSPRDGDMVDN